MILFRWAEFAKIRQVRLVFHGISMFPYWEMYARMRFVFACFALGGVLTGKKRLAMRRGVFYNKMPGSDASDHSILIR